MAVTTLRKKAPAHKGMSDSEWRLRCDLAACYQLMDLYGFTDLANNHISVRAPGAEDHFLLNPYGVLYDQITASCLLKVDVEGRVIEGEDDRLNRAGFVIHSAIHMAQRNMTCVMHTHTRANNAVGALKEGLLPLNQKALTVMAVLRYHDYEGPSLELGERERLLQHLGDGRVMVLRNHGALSVGRSIAEAFAHMYRFEMACQYQVDTLACAAGGAHLNIPSKAIIKRSIELAKKMLASGQIMQTGREWPSLIAKLERERGTSYRT
ncbi:MAG TPA: class II aldolase/adducin family protein [Burkholderiales bacterium]|nr:class II aldolase/adducin family protein [Burkholderiales bacterium]